MRSLPRQPAKRRLRRFGPLDGIRSSALGFATCRSTSTALTSLPTATCCADVDLGNKPPIHHSRTLALGNYLTAALPAPAVIVDTYSAVSSWPTYEHFAGNPPPEDAGCNMLSVLKYWRHSGLGKSDKITAFAAIQLKNHDELRTAVSLFGCAHLGVTLPDDVWAPGWRLNCTPLARPSTAKSPAAGWAQESKSRKEAVVVNRAAATRRASLRIIAGNNLS